MIPGWTRVARGLLVAALVLAGGGRSAAQGPPAKVSVARVTERTFTDTLEIVGEAEAWRSGRASTEVDGLVATVTVENGQTVSKGDVVVTLESTLLEIRARGAAAELELAKQQLLEYERGSRPEDVAEARARVAEAEAQKREADEDLERVRKLRQRDAASPEDLTAAEARAQVAASMVASRKAALQRIEKGPRIELIERARAQVAIRQAEYDEIRDDIRRTSIRAPFGGTVIRKLVEVGHFVKRGDPVIEMVQTTPIRVVVPVPERRIGSVRVAASIDVRLDALGVRLLQGKVEAIIPTADPASKTFPVKLVLPNAGGRILPGMTARVFVPVTKPRRSLAVPRDAIVRGPAGSVVYAVRGGKAALVPVRTGSARNGFVEVTGPLKRDETVVVRGNERLFPGQAVIVIPSGDPRGNGR